MTAGLLRFYTLAEREEVWINPRFVQSVERCSGTANPDAARVVLSEHTVNVSGSVSWVAERLRGVLAPEDVGS